LKNVGNHPEDYYPLVFHDVRKTFSVSELRTAGKPHNYTINDIVLAALVAAWYRLHKSNGKSVSKVTVGFIKNFRAYSHPLVSGNDWQSIPASTDVCDVGLDLLSSVQNTMNEHKQGFTVLKYLNALQQMVLYKYPSPTFREIFRMGFNYFILLTTNSKGPSTELHI
jgi:hypothetical protein